MAEEENNGYQTDSAPDVKYKHFKELKKLPDILGNYSNKGWFTDSSLTSIMYSSGYTDINNTDQNLVKLFDASTQTGFRMSEGEAKGQQLTGKCYIENFADEKYDDLTFKNIDNLRKLFNSDYRYICGSKKSAITDTVIASASRYKDKLKNLDINTKKLIRKSNHIGDKNYRIYLVNSEYSNYGNQRIIKDIVKEQNYDKCFDDETQSKFENAFKSKNFEGNFKFIKDTEDKLNNLISETISEENYEQIVDSSIEIINDFLKQLKNSETIFKDYPLMLEYLGCNYINNNKAPINCEIDFGSDTITTQFSKGKIDQKKDKEGEKIINEIDVIVSAIEDLYKYIQKEYETGIGWTIDENNNLSIQKDYEIIGDSKIYYFDDEKEHTFLDYTSTNNKNFSGIVSERAEEATDGLKGNLEDYYLVGIKLYLGFRDKKLKESIDIEGMLNKPITANNNIKEIGFFFRKKRDDEKKLYRYVVNLETYKTVIKSKYENKEPLYFVPFLTETLGDRKTQNYEAWYGKIEGNKYIPFTSLSQEEQKEEPIDKRVCLNLGKFEGDLYGLNGLPTQEAKSLKTLNLIVNENSSAVAYYINDWTNETKENTDNFIKEEITAKDLKGVVIGCFTKDKPWINAKPDGWAYTSNPETFKVNLKQQKEETTTYDLSGKEYRNNVNKNVKVTNFVNETRYYFNAIIKDKDENETKVYDINFRDLFDDEKFTMSTFEADINENGKKIQYTQKDDTQELEKQVGLNRIISPGDTIFKATFTVEDIDYYNNILYQITKIGNKEIDTLQRGNGEAANYYNISDSLVNRVANNECYVGIDGLIKTSVPSDDNSKCAMYLDTAVDVMTIGFGITYAAFGAVKAIQPETETYKAMKKFQEENPNYFERQSNGQLKYIYVTGKKAESWKKKINQDNPTNINAYLIAPEEYAVTVKDSKFCMKQILHDTYLPLVIKDLVEVYKVLYGINGEFTAEDLINSVFKYISQTALDILVDCKYNGSYGKTYFIDPLITKIKEELSGKNTSELTDDERYTILNKCMRIQAEETSKEKNTINNRLKQFGKNLDDFYLIQKNAGYSTTDKKNTGPLTIELECISNVNGLVESIFGDAFYQFKR